MVESKKHIIKGYCDFNLCPSPPTLANIKNMCYAALQAGYTAVAINTHLDENIFESRKNKKKTGEKSAEPADIIPLPVHRRDLETEFRGKLKILHRLTVSMNDNLQIHKLNQSKNVNLYDILAVLPLNPISYQFACSSMDVDIITYEPNNNSAFRISRKTLGQARFKNVHFELNYAPCVMESGCRRNTIALAHALHTVGRGHVDIIVSSGATHPDQIRSAYDVTNLGFLFGLSEAGSRNAIKNACQKVLLAAHSRKTKKACVSVEVADSNDSDSLWTDMLPMDGLCSSGDSEENNDESSQPAKRRRGPD